MSAGETIADVATEEAPAPEAALGEKIGSRFSIVSDETGEVLAEGKVGKTPMARIAEDAAQRAYEFGQQLDRAMQPDARLRALGGPQTTQLVRGMLGDAMDAMKALDKELRETSLVPDAAGVAAVAEIVLRIWRIAHDVETSGALKTAPKD